MENRKELQIRELTPAQLYALELAARRHRSAEIGRLLAAAGRNVKYFVSRFFASRGSREVRHA